MRTRRVPPTVRRGSVEVQKKSRASPRKRQRTDYASMDGIEDLGSNSDYVEEEEEEEEKNSEELLSRCVYLYVTCGTKEGLLHVENLERGQEDCIESDGRWFSPSGFEEFGGKGTHKKWKNSIIHNNKPLHFWIDRGRLKAPPNKRRTFVSSEPSNPKKSHPEESDDKSNHEEEECPDEQPETSEGQTDVQNGEYTETNDFAIDIERIMSQRKPKLILHRLVHLQGDFHLLLNNVVLPQNGSGSMPAEEQREETSLHGSNNENEEQDEAECMHVEDIIITKDRGVGMLQEKGKIDVQNEVEIVASNLEEQSEENIVLSEDDTSGPVETSVPKEETFSYSSNKENEEVECMHIEDTIITKDQWVGTTSLDGIIDTKTEVEVVAPSFQINLQLEEEEEASPPDEIIQDAPLIERPPQEDNPSVSCDPAATTAHPSAAEVDAMELEELKREKIKWQIKVLKLQEEYYSLQLQKLKQ